ncbi:MAG: hypothetical protein AAF899_06045 [Pseudomonadota bacterium]
MTNVTIMRRIGCAAVAAAAIVSSTGTPSNASGEASGVMAMCMARGIDDHTVCVCAEEKLVGVIGDESLLLYAAVGTAFVGDMKKGMDMGLSWDMAIDHVSANQGIGRTPLLERMNRAGRDHRIAIRQCREAG